ncbi:MAG: 3-phosphoshikimate 1-carboxyvinyltransferase [Planctomycetaceae bacterium]|nr:3-phosphoshikimate 1-carboxyvinyltransferase [Planctomycetaceae bacterium]
MTDSIEIQPARSVGGSIRPPGSKSITNRALVCAALANGPSTLIGVLDSDDTRVMIEALKQLGISVVPLQHSNQLQVTGCGGTLPRAAAELFVGNSGTTVRFLTAMLAACHGEFRLDGVARMQQRPIQDLVEALSQLGADVRSEQGTGCPPVVLSASGLAGGTVTIRGSISSQYLSGLMMAAPCARSPVTVEVLGELVSQPYVSMTASVMEAFGTHIDLTSLTQFTIPVDAGYRPTQYSIEPDASAASYFWAAAAIAGGKVHVEGLSRGAIQGDVAFCECLAQMGCQVETTTTGISVARDGSLHGIDVDMNSISDTAQTLAAVALFADGATRIRGIGHNRHKETDRIGDLARELRKLGGKIAEHDDGLTISPGPLRSATIDTYDDHRMAMSLALTGLRIPQVVIRDPACTSKTYPQFFTDLSKICREP